MGIDVGKIREGKVIFNNYEILKIKESPPPSPMEPHPHLTCPKCPPPKPFQNILTTLQLCQTSHIDLVGSCLS